MVFAETNSLNPTLDISIDSTHLFGGFHVSLGLIHHPEKCFQSWFKDCWLRTILSLLNLWFHAIWQKSKVCVLGLWERPLNLRVSKHKEKGRFTCALIKLFQKLWWEVRNKKLVSLDTTKTYLEIFSSGLHSLVTCDLWPYGSCDLVEPSPIPKGKSFDTTPLLKWP